MKREAKNGLQKKKSYEVQKKNNVSDQRKVVFNLSDNELYLSVMKIQEAHEIILQILMGDPKLRLKTIHVEDVILNKSGRKSIRLDAYGNDQAQYWFSEQCHDPQGMELGDGTKKCFCNMSSKQGDLELVSLLQYMKNTRRDNPEVVFWSERLERLHEIVEEVRESEEWEEIYMSAYSEILEIGKQEGEKKGQEKKTREIIASLAERNFSPGDIAQIVKVSEKYVRQQLKKSHR